jgi:hypothetical protein
VEDRIESEGRLRLHSLNPLYDPYFVDIKDIREIWKFIHYISAELPEPNLPKNEFASSIASLKKEMAEIKSRLKQGKLFEE